MMRLLTFVLVASVAHGLLVAPQKKEKANTTAAPKPVVATNATKIKVKNVTETDKLEAVSKGLKTIQNLRALFTNKAGALPDGAEKFANGAMSTELAKADSSIWATIDGMMSSVTKLQGQMKGKSEDDQEKLMNDLEDDLDAKASDLGKVNDQVGKKQELQDEQYMLGLLNLHQKDWSMEKQLNATATFMTHSTMLKQLYEHHDSTKPLAQQLAALMDAAKPKAVKAVAAKMFLQLVSDIRQMNTTATNATKSVAGNATTKVAKAKNQTESDKLSAVAKGLETIKNLRSLFTNKEGSLPDGAEKFANGAMSTELGKADSSIWSTIDGMLGSVAKMQGQMKGKSEEEQEKLMDNLENDLDSKASNLSKVSDDVSKKQKEQDEQYLLGLLNMHSKDWSMEKQLNATAKFMGNSDVIQKLYKHHDDKKPLAPQLAALMDAEPKAVKAKAAKMFLQLVSSIHQL